MDIGLVMERTASGGDESFELVQFDSR